MFFEEGWVPLSEVTGDVFRRLQVLQSEGRIGKGHGSLRAVLSVTVWDICEATAKLGVTGSDGTVIAASRDLVAWADPTQLFNEHLNLQIGNVGSSDLLDAHGELPDAETLAGRYGPFLNLPVVIPINTYQSSVGYMAEEVGGDLTTDTALIDGAKTILSMAEGGALLTRETARAKIGTALSRRKFKLAWAMAAAKRPELNKPNRWLGL
ncbi:hypothetical protein P1J78_08295 [Psychromarinibacter sp. C21-152]|uniref:Uncharacterized protein n=1 Tax=Psychromarinibacter sediminicola TaxID=3033385 RepID=A0AAE3T801_9RHOB|nr:hypothetical protein [Psychromarinibacter sediminicola]MDF0600727.1 hypothetical protein [Psychromarinibacter sediminicola]